MAFHYYHAGLDYHKWLVFFIYSFNKHILITYSVLDIIVGTRDTNSQKL